MSDLHKAAQQALWAFQCHVEQTWPIDRSTAAIAALRTALAQQAEPKGGGNLPPPLQAEPVTEDMKSAVRWAPSSAYWSKRLREFFGPDAREGIDALERRIAGAQERAEPDLSRCPQCNGPADNGHDRSIPPSPYLCTKCMAEPVHKCPNCASLEAQNTELDLKLAELERAIGKEPVAWIQARRRARVPWALGQDAPLPRPAPAPAADGGAGGVPRRHHPHGAGGCVRRRFY
jgi:hypothetical protein